MPKLNGNETLLRLRKEKKLAEVPIIFLSAYDMNEDIQQGLSSGANGFIQKPIDLETMVDTIKKAITS